MFTFLAIGKTGNGKSALCNTILGRDEFETGSRMDNTTETTQYAETERAGLRITVVDTPDLTNYLDDPTKQERELSEWARLTKNSSRPYAVLLAVRCDVKYTPEEWEIYRKIKDAWDGSEMCKRLVVAFTFGDRQDKQIEKELKEVCQELKSVLKDASHRYVVFDNTARDKEPQVYNLMTKVQQLMGIKIGKGTTGADNTRLHTQDQPTGRDLTVPPSNELRVVLLGKTGSGKSSLGNTLLGRDEFQVTQGMMSGIEKCQWGQTERDGVVLQVTDTPGLCDMDRNDEDILGEVAKCVAVTSPGPHIVLMVLRCGKRFTQEECESYRTLKNLFGAEIRTHMIVVFSGIDTRPGTADEQRAGLKMELERAPPNLKQVVIRDADNRFFGVNNVSSREERDAQAEMLIIKMKELMHMNGGLFLNSKVNQEISAHVQKFSPLAEPGAPPNIQREIVHGNNVELEKGLTVLFIRRLSRLFRIEGSRGRCSLM